MGEIHTSTTIYTLVVCLRLKGILVMVVMVQTLCSYRFGCHAQQ